MGELGQCTRELACAWVFGDSWRTRPLAGCCHLESRAGAGMPEACSVFPISPQLPAHPGMLVPPLGSFSALLPPPCSPTFFLVTRLEQRASLLSWSSFSLRQALLLDLKGGSFVLFFFHHFFPSSPLQQNMPCLYTWC